MGLKWLLVLEVLVMAAVVAGAPRTKVQESRMQKEQRYMEMWSSITDMISMTCEMSASIRRHRYKNIINLNKMFMLVYSSEKYIPYKMKTASKRIPKSKYFSIKKSTVIYIHGYNGYPDAIGVTRIGRAVEMKGRQFLSLDIRNYITGSDYLFIGGLIKYLGWALGDFISDLYLQGMSVHNIHVVGLSLGAQIATFACKRFTEKHNLLLERFTALDPTAQCYSLNPSIGISPSDATYVDIIHTSVLSYTRNFKGHAEYYINERNGIQPGCTPLDLQCSHSRALHLFGETVKNEDWFPAKRCRNITTYDCQIDEISLMGYGSQNNSRGDYFIRTSSQSPYALGLYGLV